MEVTETNTEGRWACQKHFIALLLHYKFFKCPDVDIDQSFLSVKPPYNDLDM